MPGVTNKPTHTCYAVREFTKAEGEVDAEWTKMGAAWLHKDGKGFNIELEAFPKSGRLVMRLNKAKPAKTD